MMPLPETKSRKKGLLAGVCFLLLLIPFVSSEYVVLVATQIFIWAAFAISYDLLIGYTGIVSFGHALFFGSGAYTSALLVLKWGMGFWFTLPFVILVCGLFGLLIGLLTLRFSDIYFTMLTLALGQFFFILVWKNYEFMGGDDGLHGLPMILPSKTYTYFAVLLFLAVVYWLCRRLVNSPFGTTLVAIRENEFRAKMLGYDVLRYKLMVLQISGMIAGVAGALNGAVLASVFPQYMNADTTLTVILMTVIGGMGTLTGPVLGAALFTLAEQYLSSFFHFWLMILGVIFVFIVFFVPEGIISLRRFRK